MIRDLQVIPSATTTTYINTVISIHNLNTAAADDRGEESNISLMYIMTKHHFSLSHTQIYFRLSAHTHLSVSLGFFLSPSLSQGSHGGQGAVNLIDISVGLSN